MEKSHPRPKGWKKKFKIRRIYTLLLMEYLLILQIFYTMEIHLQINNEY